jgi:hypothetical protein
METSGGTIVTECHSDGTISWDVNPAGLKDRCARSVELSSAECKSKRCHVKDLQKFHEMSASLQGRASVQSYAEQMFTFASSRGRASEPEGVQGPVDAKSEPKSHDNSRSIDFDVSCFESFDPSAIQVEIVEPVDGKYKTFGGRCMLLRNILTASECAYLIEEMDKDMEQVSYRQNYRVNDRCVFESSKFAGILWKRVRPFASELSIVVDRDGAKQHLVSEEPGDCPHDLRVGYGKEGTWHPAGLNECLRFCKYNPGGFFRKHTDACFVRSEEEQSLFTCMFYLNGDFNGGATRFLRLDGESNTDFESQFKLADGNDVLASVAPETGLCMLFFQPGLLHEGEDLRSGLKYILRTDMMFRRDPATKTQHTPQEEEAMALLHQAQAAEERGECNLACSLYRRAFKMDPNLEQMIR